MRVEREKAPAKVNLYLHITGRREDGYHLLDSLFVFAGVHDVVEARISDDLSLTVSGPGEDGLEGGRGNLVLRAAHLLRARTGVELGADLRLHKHLPMAAGLGGGSADAAATLRLLNRLWDTGLGERELARLGEELGADVPACVFSRPLRIGGVGETVDPIGPVPPIHMVLVNPGVPLSTPTVFLKWRETGAPFSKASPVPVLDDTASFLSDLRQTTNDLEPAAIALAPEVAEVLDALWESDGCALARMSGSGASCFGMFRNGAEATRAARAIAQVSGWWVWSGVLA